MTSYKNTKGKIKRNSVKRRNNKRGGQDFRKTINKQTGIEYNPQPNDSFKFRRLVSSLTGMYTTEGEIKKILNDINNGNEINEDSRLKFLFNINDNSIKINDNTRYLLDKLKDRYKNNFPFSLKVINVKVTDNHSNTGGGKTNTQPKKTKKTNTQTKKTKPTTQSKIDDYFNKENIFSTPKKATQERKSEEVPPTIRHYYNENGESFKMLRPDGEPYTTADTGPFTIVPFTPVTPKKTPPSIKHSPTGNTPVTEIYDDKTDTTTKILTKDGKIYTNADRAAGKQGYLNGVEFTRRNLFNGGKKINIPSNKRTKKRKKKTKKRSKSRNTIRH
jgi:hypothetical protein